MSWKRSRPKSEDGVVATSYSDSLQLSNSLKVAEKTLEQNLHQIYKRKGGGGHGSSSHGSSTHGSTTHGTSGGDDEGSSTSGSTSKGGGSTSKGSPAAKHGASATFINSRGAQGFSISKSGKIKGSATAYSDGGGSRFTLGSGTTFSGRFAGGSTRTNIYGTSRFGSGYPYGGYGTYVGYRPFPYVFYPIPPAHRYYGGDEYVNATDRPGGVASTAIVQPSYNTSLVTYRLLGDLSSVSAVLDALVANCSVANSSSSISPYTPSPSTWPLPEQIIQYYRASSFSLSLDGYNNSAALPSNMPASNDTAPIPLEKDTPLPAGLNMTFLTCINATIGASVPLIDTSDGGLSDRIITLIVIMSILGAVLPAVIIVCLYRRQSRKRRLREIGLARDLGTEAPKPLKGSSWFSRIPFAKRFGYRSVDSPREKQVEDDWDDLDSPGARTSVTGVTVVGDPPAYSKEFHGKSLADVANSKAVETESALPEYEYALQGQSGHPQPSNGVNDREEGTALAFPTPHPHV